MNTKEFLKYMPFLSWLLLVTVISRGVVSSFVGLLVPEMSASFEVDYQDISFMMLTGTVGAVLGALLGSKVGSHVQPRYLALIYLTGILISLVLFAVAWSFSILVFAFFFQCVFLVMLSNLIAVLTKEMHPESMTRTRIFSMNDMGFSMGMTLGPLWVAFFLAWQGSWRTPYLVFIAVILVLMYFIRSKTLFNQHVKEDLTTPVYDLTSTHQPSPQVEDMSLLELTRSPKMAWGWLALACLGYLEWGHAYWYVAYATERAGEAINQARITFACFTSGMILARAMQAFVHSTISAQKRITFMICIAVIGFSGLLISPSIHWTLGMYLSNFLAGLGIGIGVSVMLSGLIDLSPHNTAKISTLSSLSVNGGVFVSSFVIGFLSKKLSVFWGYATIVVVCAFLLYVLFKFYRKIKLI